MNPVVNLSSLEWQSAQGVNEDPKAEEQRFSLALDG